MKRYAARVGAGLEALAAALVAFLPLLASAQGDDAGTWLLRARALHLNPGIQDTIGLAVSVTPLNFTELDATWFINPHWALEFAITVPQKHSVMSAGFEVGRLNQLPPTLVLQYHHSIWRLRPYVGLGINYTLVDNLRFSPDTSPALQASVRNNSIAGVVALGVDVPLGGGWVFNADVKRMQLKTRLNTIDPAFGSFKVNPVLTSLGLGWRF